MDNEEVVWEELNFLCFNPKCEGNTGFTFALPVGFKLIIFKNKYGYWEGIKCPMCKKNAKWVGRPFGGSAEVDARIQEGRRQRSDDLHAHAKDVIQPHRMGEPSKEFIEAYPQQAKRYFKPEEMKKAKYVWKDLK